ncbi:hypothetical protein J6590_082799 [Homalodisca vitripennis]|nr:hypothetical protein J6590_082799 [Homalodisca vitripennis]
MGPAASMAIVSVAIKWKYTFYIIIAVHLIAALLYWAFASGERQRWAPPAPTPESESLSRPQRSHIV